MKKEQLEKVRAEYLEVVEAAKELLAFLGKVVPKEITISGTDIGAEGVKDRLQRLEVAVKPFKRKG